MKLLIVESPAKARSIQKYVGTDYEVLPTIGHIRQLPSKNGSVIPEENFQMIYEDIPKAKEVISKIISIAKKSDIVYIASDPDREGEGIAYSVYETLIRKKAISADKIYRVTYNEITKTAILNALKNPRRIDNNLVDAQQARLALDYLVGYTLSPVLWKKLPGSRSAGRVQSVALRIITDREIEIKHFKPQEYWTINANIFVKSDFLNVSFVSFGEEKFSKDFPKNEKISENIRLQIEKAKKIIVLKKENKEITINSPVPFTTALLQQEASRKLGFSAKRTMSVAQKLYEGISINGENTGLITYMRTDGMSISHESLVQIREEILQNFGENYLPKTAKLYKTKNKNAQEAHEAIRPTDISIKPNDIKNIVDNDQYRLYDLIWKRTLACQMEKAIQSRESILFLTKCQDGDAISKANGSRIKFDGFLKAYSSASQEEKDDVDIDESTTILPDINEGDVFDIDKVEKDQHFTLHPPRFTEASLIKKLEENGIGRPSTYATIISTLLDREYVVLQNKCFIAEPRGIVVVEFLKNFFTKYIEYGYTAGLEEQLDLVSSGELLKLKLLEEFWSNFKNNIDAVLNIDYNNVAKTLTEKLKYFLFNKNDKIEDQCPKCKNGILNLANGKFGPFISCSNYPECKFISNFDNNVKNLSEHTSVEEIKFHENDRDLILKTGRYGAYFEVLYNGKKQNFSFPKNVEINKENALFYTSLPKILGQYNEKNVTISIGKFGPYILHDGIYASVSKILLHELNLDMAIKIWEEKKKFKKSGNISKKTKKVRKISAK